MWDKRKRYERVPFHNTLETANRGHVVKIAGPSAKPGTQQIPAQPALLDYAENLMEKILGEEHFAELKASAEYQAALNKMTEKLKHWIVQSSPEIFKQIPLIVLFLVKGISDLLISILFRFIIVLQLPSLQTGFSRLENSRLSRFYEEIVPDIIGFGKSIGRAFQAQALIAICNTFLTFLGLIFFNVPSPLFLSDRFYL
jgi:predicted PurR-regulated permease PerM